MCISGAALDWIPGTCATTKKEKKKRRRSLDELLKLFL